jgi:hypothetical protein
MRALGLGDESSTPTCTTTREPAFAFPSSRGSSRSTWPVPELQSYAHNGWSSD